MHQYKTKFKYKIMKGVVPSTPLFKKKVTFFNCGAKTNIGIIHMLRVDAHYRLVLRHMFRCPAFFENLALTH